MRFEAMLRLLRTFIKHHHTLSPDSLVEIRKKTEHIVEKLHNGVSILSVRWRVSWLLKFIEDNTTLRYSHELNASYLLEYMDCLCVNLNGVLMCRSMVDIEDLIRLLKQVKIVQRKMGFLRYLYAMEIKGNVDHEKIEGLETRIQFLADNVGQFCLVFWAQEDKAKIYEDDENYIYYFLGKPSYLLCLVKLVQLEMQKFFHGELKASKFCQSKTFKYQKLRKKISHHLHSLLMYLRNTKLDNFPNNVSTRNMDEAIEFLLFFLADLPNHFIDDKMLKEVFEEVGAIAGDVLFVIQKLLPSSLIKDNTSKINLCLISIVEKTENLKAQEEKYYKSLKFTHSHEFPTFGGLSFLNSLLRKLNEIKESESSLNFMMKPHIGIFEKEFSSLTSIFRDVAKLHHEHEFFKDRQRLAINLAYEVEVAIDSILA